MVAAMSVVMAQSASTCTKKIQDPKAVKAAEVICSCKPDAKVCTCKKGAKDCTCKKNAAKTSVKTTTSQKATTTATPAQ